MDILDIPVLKRIYPSIVRRFLMLIGRNKNEIKIGKYIFELDIRESIERKTYFLGHYEKERIEYLLENSKEINSKVLIDVGANIGFYSILLSDQFNQIHSFEPNKRNYEVLIQNIKRNFLSDKIKTYFHGLGDKKETLMGSSRSKGELFQTSGFAVSKNIITGEEVSIVKGDDILEFIDQIITIKIDVEGFELSVIKGLNKILENNYCFIQIEIWDKNYEDVLLFFKKLNYRKILTIDGDTYFSNIGNL